MKKQILAAFLASITVTGTALPVLATTTDDLIKRSLTKNLTSNQTTEKEAAAEKQTPQTAPADKAATADGQKATVADEQKATAATTADEKAATPADEKKPAAKASTAAASGAFTGSTPLVQYLYTQFSKNPAKLSIPTKLFSSRSTSQQFEELGNAAIEAYIQNGLTDYVVDFRYSSSSGSSNISMNIVYNNKDTKSRQAQGQALNQKATEIVAAVIQPGMSDREKAQALSTYVAQNVKYDFDGFKKYQAGENVFGLQTAYAGLVGGKAICQGFARAYKLLCDKAGVPCVVIFGKTKQFDTAHAWCRVLLDGKWETVDTSNPQLGINHVGSFCIPADVVNSTLVADGAKTLVPSKAAAYLS